MTIDQVEQVLTEARRLKKEGLYTEALALLTPLVELEPPPTGALLLASACVRLLDPTANGASRAEVWLRRALQIDPTSVEATIELGHLLLAHGRDVPLEVPPIAERALVLVNQADVSLTLLRAAIFRYQENQQAAYEIIREGAARHPKSRLLANELHLLKRALKIP
jgi:hypothetical protein